MYYSMTIAGLKRDLPICPVNENLSIAGFVIFGDQELTVACARELLKKAPEYDYIITAEAKGIPLAHEMARQAGDAKYFVARKGSKLYMRDTFGVAVRSITTDREQHLYLDGQDAKLIKGKRILILDDVISTGESLSALEALVEKAAALSVAAWPFWPRAMPKTGTTSSIWSPCPCSTPMAPQRNNPYCTKALDFRFPRKSRAFLCTYQSESQSVSPLSQESLLSQLKSLSLSERVCASVSPGSV